MSVMKNKKTTEIVVTRTFASNSVKLFDLYANYVAKRILVEKGILQEEIKDSGSEKALDISGLTW